MLLFSCKSPKEREPSKEKEPLAIVISDIYKPKIDPNRKKDEPPPPPPPIPPTYMWFHFVIDSAENLFFYELPDKLPWRDESDLSNNIPQYIALQPHQIIQIPSISIEEFIKLNILNQNPIYRVVIIGSLRDTLKSAVASRIIRLLEDSLSDARWGIRLATHEESTVLDHKKRNQRLSRDDIKWDSTRIRFREN